MQLSQHSRAVAHPFLCGSAHCTTSGDAAVLLNTNFSRSFTARDRSAAVGSLTREITRACCQARTRRPVHRRFPFPSQGNLNTRSLSCIKARAEFRNRAAYRKSLCCTSAALAPIAATWKLLKFPERVCPAGDERVCALSPRLPKKFPSGPSPTPTSRVNPAGKEKVCLPALSSRATTAPAAKTEIDRSGSITSLRC